MLQSWLPLTEYMGPKFVIHQICMSKGVWKAALSSSGLCWFWSCQITTSLQTKAYLLNWKTTYLTNCAWGYHSHTAPQTCGHRLAIFLSHVTNSPREDRSSNLHWVCSLLVKGDNWFHFSVMLDLYTWGLRRSLRPTITQFK